MVENVRGKDIVDKVVISEETGRKFGSVGDVSFITESGELLNIVLSTPTRHASELKLEKDDKGRILIPFSAVRSIGDFVIISEKDLI